MTAWTRSESVWRRCRRTLRGCSTPARHDAEERFALGTDGTDTVGRHGPRLSASVGQRRPSVSDSVCPLTATHHADSLLPLDGNLRQLAHEVARMRRLVSTGAGQVRRMGFEGEGQ